MLRGLLIAAALALASGVAGAATYTLRGTGVCIDSEGGETSCRSEIRFSIDPASFGQTVRIEDIDGSLFDSGGQLIADFWAGWRRDTYTGLDVCTDACAEATTDLSGALQSLWVNCFHCVAMFREWDADCYKCGMDVELSIEGWRLIGGGPVPDFAVGGWDVISAPIPPSFLLLLSGIAMLRVRSSQSLPGNRPRRS